MFIPRLIAVDAGKADTLITPVDKKVALAFGKPVPLAEFEALLPNC